MKMLNYPTSERQFIMYEALRKGADIQELYRKTFIKPWFLQQMKELVELEEKILKYKGKNLPDDLLIQAKKDGFADKYLAKLLGVKRSGNPGAAYSSAAWWKPGTMFRSAGQKMPAIIIPPTMLRTRP